MSDESKKEKNDPKEWEEKSGRIESYRDFLRDMREIQNDRESHGGRRYT